MTMDIERRLVSHCIPTSELLHVGDDQKVRICATLLPSSLFNSLSIYLFTIFGTNVFHTS